MAVEFPNTEFSDGKNGRESCESHRQQKGQIKLKAVTTRMLPTNAYVATSAIKIKGIKTSWLKRLFRKVLPFLDNAEKNNFRNKTLNDISCSGTPKLWQCHPGLWQAYKSFRGCFWKKDSIEFTGTLKSYFWKDKNRISKTSIVYQWKWLNSNSKNCWP